MNDKYQIIRSLYSGMPLDEALSPYGIRVCTQLMNACIRAFVYPSRRGRYYIIGNDSLSPNEMKKVFFHEICHFIEDMPKTPRTHYRKNISSGFYYFRFYKITVPYV